MDNQLFEKINDIVPDLPINVISKLNKKGVRKHQDMEYITSFDLFNMGCNDIQQRKLTQQFSKNTLSNGDDVVIEIKKLCLDMDIKCKAISYNKWFEIENGLLILENNGVNKGLFTIFGKEHSKSKRNDIWINKKLGFIEPFTDGNRVTKYRTGGRKQFDCKGQSRNKIKDILNIVKQFSINQ